LLGFVARQKALNYTPGAEFLYSNTNYFLLAEVVKRSTNKPLSAFAAENIFHPLGMTHTRFYDDRTAVVLGRVPAYAPGKNGSFLVNWSTNFDKVGDGGLMSSVDDLLLWDRNFYASRLGRGTLLKEMQTRGVLNNGKQISYALGLVIGTYRGLSMVEHGGALFGYRTEILRFPEQRFTVLCLCNLSSADPGELSRKVADIYLSKDLQTTTAPMLPSGSETFSDLGPFAGKYRNPSDHSVLSFTVSGGSLAALGRTFRHTGTNRFEGSGAIITFDNSIGPTTVTIDRAGENFFTGTRFEEVHVADAALADYAGTYTSTELDATYRLAVANGSLVLRMNWNRPLKLSPIARDEFETGSLGTLVFQRDAKDRILSLWLFAGRVRNVTFEKTH
ncbi:MAG: serine hydrolase, partial [Acidobacteriota bacterium]|nr:serine hydrolase [Acidobacteriota bacterium]